MKERIFMNGRWVPLAQAHLSPLNSAVLYGESLLEAIPVYGGKALFLKEHMGRLDRGCRFLGWSRLALPKVDQAIRTYRSKGKDYMLRVGLVQELEPPAAPRDFSKKPPLFFAMARPLRHSLTDPRPLRGRIGVGRWRVPGPEVYPGQFKWIFYMMIREDFRHHPTWTEMLRLDRDGYVVDGGSSSPLWAKNGVLHPPLQTTGGLESVTRTKILRFARSLGIPVRPRRWRPQDVLKGGELFLVGSGIGVLQATHLSGKVLRGSRSISSRLWEHYRSHALGLKS
ncbi:MAG TPA: aminotransferase class IV [bacterium]|nr:aminotransferase class IV [bacterium]